MGKECRECRSVMNNEAPYCTSCGYRFRPQRVKLHRATWQGRIIAIACGLLAPLIVQWVGRSL